MRHRKYSSLVTLGFLTASLLTTSLGGIFATPGLAATPDVNIQSQKNDNTGLIAGVAALGVISLLSKHTSGTTASSGVAVNSSANTTTTATTTTTTTQNNTTSAASAEQRAFNLLNADRASNGLKPLKFNSKLTALGENYAQDMINRNFFSHTNPQGQSPFDRMKQAGISYRYAGENIAINSNVDTAEQAFMNSAGHRANILNTNYTDVGIGVRYDATGSAHVVQEFISN